MSYSIRTRLSHLGVLGVAAVMLLSACSTAALAPGADTAPAPTSAVAKATTATPAPTAAPAKQKPAIVLQEAEAAGLDPHFNMSNAQSNITSYIQETLVEIEFDDKNNVSYRGKLAEKWEILNNERTWRFYLRKGIKFSNGEPFNAQAVKYTVDRQMDPAIKSQKRFDREAGLDRIEIVDDYTVDIITKEPCALMLVRLNGTPILPPNYYRSTPMEQLATKPIGTGPYVLKEWIKDDHATLEARADYWGKPSAIQTVIVRPVREAVARVAELEVGSADLIGAVPPDDLARLSKVPGVKISFAEGRRVYIGFNMDRGYLKDKRVRQALNYAINWDAINNSLYNSQGKHTYSLVKGADAHPDLKPYPYDPAKAKALLADAGFPKDQVLTLNTMTNIYSRSDEMLEAIKKDLSQVGVKVDIKFLSSSEREAGLTKKMEQDLFLLALGSRGDGPQDVQMLRNSYVYNSGRYNNPVVENLLDELLATADPKRVRDIVFKIQEATYDDPPCIYLWNQLTYFGYRDRIEGWKAVPSEGMYLKNAWFKATGQ